MTLPPVRRQVIVPVTPEVAFDRFTADIGVWWPISVKHSVFGPGATVSFVDGELVERSPDGAERSVWGEVLDWQPGRLLRLTWHPGHPVERHTLLAVRFAELGDDRTLVTLEHSGWERLDQLALAARTEYAGGWSTVFGRYGTHAATEPAAVDEDEVWLILSHTPGPNAPEDGDVFASPDFGRHVVFVKGLLAEGVVVGAGPIAGHTGHGMTLLRVPAAAAADYVARAQDADESVTGGLLQVEARVWNVRMTN